MIIDIMNQPNDLTYRMLEPAPTIYPDLLVKPRIELITESNTTLNISYPLNPPSEILEQNFTINLTFCVNSLFDFYSSNNPDSLKYDTNGNLISGFGFTYDYNEANQLARVKAGSTVIAEYIYDYTGQRFRKNSGGTTTYYLSKDFETKVNSSGTFNTAYYYANGELLARKDPNGQRYYYHNDHLTGTNVVTDSSGNLAERTRYKPFGGIIEGGLSRNLFTGQEWDKDTGQYYYGARYYNPTLMRFTQADPVIQNFYDPQQLNRYSYALNNPLKYNDPTGNYAQLVSSVLRYGISAVSDFALYMSESWFAFSVFETTQTAYQEAGLEGVAVNTAEWVLGPKILSSAGGKIASTASRIEFARELSAAVKGSNPGLYNSLKGAKTITNAPLKDYKGGIAKETVLTEDVQAVRYFGGESPQKSKWFTTMESNNPESLKGALSLSEGATAENYAMVTIPKDTTIRTGFTNGGTLQIEVFDDLGKVIWEKTGKTKDLIV